MDLQEFNVLRWNFIARNNNIVSAIEIIERNRILLGLRVVIYNSSHEPPLPVPVCISCFYVHSSIYQQAVVCVKRKTQTIIK